MRNDSHYVVHCGAKIPEREYRETLAAIDVWTSLNIRYLDLRLDNKFLYSHVYFRRWTDAICEHASKGIGEIHGKAKLP